MKFITGSIVSVIARPRGVRLDGNGVANTSERTGQIDVDITVDEELEVLMVAGAKALCLRSNPDAKFAKVWVHRNHVFAEASEKYAQTKILRQGKTLPAQKTVAEQIAELEAQLAGAKRKAEAEMEELQQAISGRAEAL